MTEQTIGPTGGGLRAFKRRTERLLNEAKEASRQMERSEMARLCAISITQMEIAASVLGRAIAISEEGEEG